MQCLSLIDVGVYCIHKILITYLMSKYVTTKYMWYFDLYDMVHDTQRIIDTFV